MKKLCLALITFLTCCLSASAQSGLFIAPNSSPITSPVVGQSWLFNSSNYTVGVWNGSAYRLVNTPFSNYTASINPTSSNDNTQGYVIGSLWVNQVTQGIFMATNVTTSAAVWTGINAVVTTIPLNDLQQGGATNGQSLIWNNGGGVWNPGNPAINLNQLLQSGATTGQGITWNGSAWVASNVGAGTVTSVSIGNLSPLFTASVANSTTTPALSFSLTNAVAHSILSNTSGSGTTPSYNVLSLTAGAGLSGGGTLATSPTISLATPVTIANGGTGAATASAHTYFGNNTGSTASPSFSGIVTGDLPTNVVTSVTNSSTLVTGAISSQVLTLSDANAAIPISSGGTNATTAANAITNLIAGSPTTGQALEWNGSNWVPATLTGTGTVTNFSSGNASPLFTTSVATATTTPAQTFALSNTTSHSILSNTTGGSTTPSYNVLSLTAGTGLTGGGDLATSPTVALITPISNSDLGSTVVTSVGNLSPVFTTSVSAQTLGFALSNAGAHAFLGNNTGSSAAPAYVTLSAGDLPSTTVNSTGNLSPLFTSSITGQALSFSLTNATGKGVLSNASSSAAAPAYNVLTITAGTGLTGGGNLADSPTVSLSSTPTFTTVTAGHYVSNGSAPGIAAGGGAGTGPTVSISGTDTAGVITVTTGTLPSASSAVVTITFATTFGSTPHAVIIDEANANAAGLSGVTMVYVDISNVSATQFILTAGTSALTPATTYKWYYHVDG